MGNQTQLVQQFIDATNAALAALIARVASLENSRTIDEAAFKALAAQLGVDEAKIASLMSVPAPIIQSSANLLFASGFGGTTVLNPPANCWQTIAGADGVAVVHLGQQVRRRPARFA